MKGGQADSRSTPLFMTHHGPVGAWSSLTFGLPERGASVDIQKMVVEDSTGLFVGKEHPTVMREFAHWMQVTAAERTCADQIEAHTRKLLNGSYYPRMVTSSLWVMPRAPRGA